MTNTPPFHPGQRGVCVKGRKDGLFKKGDVFVITETAFGLCKCNEWVVRIGNIIGYGNGSLCLVCNKAISDGGPLWFSPEHFAPIEPRHQDVEIAEEIKELAEQFVSGTPEVSDKPKKEPAVAN